MDSLKKMPKKPTAAVKINTTAVVPKFPSPKVAPIKVEERMEGILARVDRNKNVDILMELAPAT